MMSFPEVGPDWVSGLFYAVLAAWVRAHEVVFAALDALLAWLGSDAAVAP